MTFNAQSFHIGVVKSSRAGEISEVSGEFDRHGGRGGCIMNVDIVGEQDFNVRGLC